MTIATRILTANERRNELREVKLALCGPSGLGKTSLLRTLDTTALTSTPLVGIEGGDPAIASVPAGEPVKARHKQTGRRAKHKPRSPGRRSASRQHPHATSDECRNVAASTLPNIEKASS
jgi:hypothetical protein